MTTDWQERTIQENRINFKTNAVTEILNNFLALSGQVVKERVLGSDTFYRYHEFYLEPLLVAKMSEEGSVSQCLELLGLQEFGAELVNLGFDRLNDILCLDEEDFAKLTSDEDVKAKYRTALHQGNVMNY